MLEIVLNPAKVPENAGDLASMVSLSVAYGSGLHDLILTEF